MSGSPGANQDLEYSPTVKECRDARYDLTTTTANMLRLRNLFEYVTSMVYSISLASRDAVGHSAIASAGKPIQSCSASVLSSFYLISPAAGEQQCMRDVFGDNAVYQSLVAEILSIEQGRAPNSRNSHLLGLVYSSKHMQALLTQRRHELRSILDNSLPQRLHDNLMGCMRGLPQTGQGYDLCIYMNYIVSKDILGVPIAEYDRFLTATEFASGIPALPGKSYSLDSNDLRRRVHIRYRQLCGLSGDHGFFKDFSPDSIKAQALYFVNRNRSVTLPKAQA